MRNYIEIKEFIRKVFTKISINNEKDSIVFVTSDGKQYQMYHEQDCCESVYLEDICGDINDLIDTPILQAEESTNHNEHPSGVVKDYPPESFLWTFYRITTMKGQVVLRWYGESNGYYSESVQIIEQQEL